MNLKIRRPLRTRMLFLVIHVDARGQYGACPRNREQMAPHYNAEFDHQGIA